MSTDGKSILLVEQALLASCVRRKRFCQENWSLKLFLPSCLGKLQLREEDRHSTRAPLQD